MRLLLVTSRHPLPPWRGNQVRTVQWAEALADHQVTLLCPSGRGGAVASATLVSTGRGAGALTGLARATLLGRPLQEGLYDRPAARRRLARLLGQLPPFDLVVVQLVRCAWAAHVVAVHSPGTPLLFDAIDSMGLHFARAATTAAPPWRWALAAEASRCRRREAWLADRASLVTAVSARDLAAVGGGGRRFVVPVAGRPPEGRGSEPGGPTLVVTGNLGYRPTVQGVLRFVRHSWPQVRQAVPEVRLVLAGARPDRRLLALTGQPGIEVHGDVPSLEPYLARATVALAPMAEGSGVAMKILEAWAAGVPVIAHPWAAEGLGEHASACAVPEDDRAETWAGTAQALLTDPARAAELGARGRAAWRASFAPERVAAAIRDAVAAAVA